MQTQCPLPFRQGSIPQTKGQLRTADKAYLYQSSVRDDLFRMGTCHQSCLHVSLCPNPTLYYLRPEAARWRHPIRNPWGLYFFASIFNLQTNISTKFCRRDNNRPVILGTPPQFSKFSDVPSYIIPPPNILFPIPSPLLLCPSKMPPNNC